MKKIVQDTSFNNNNNFKNLTLINYGNKGYEKDSARYIEYNNFKKNKNYFSIFLINSYLFQINEIQ